MTKKWGSRLRQAKISSFPLIIQICSLFASCVCPRHKYKLFSFKCQIGAGANVTMIRLTLLRNIILLPRQTHPGPSGHPSQEGTTPRLLRSPRQYLSIGVFMVQYFGLSTRRCVLSGNPLSRGEPHPSYRWRRWGVSAWNLHQE